MNLFERSETGCEGKGVRRLECTYVFGLECLRKTFVSFYSGSCPYCSREIKVADTAQDHAMLRMRDMVFDADPKMTATRIVGIPILYLLSPMFIIVATIMDLPAVEIRAALGFRYDPGAWQDLGTGHKIFLTTLNVHPCVPKKPVCRKRFLLWGS
jgi:hypothetical protein